MPRLGQQEGEAHVRRSRSRSLERWDSAAMSQPATGSEDLAPTRSTRFLGTQDSASGSVFAESQELRRGSSGGGVGGGGVDEEKGRG